MLTIEVLVSLDKHKEFGYRLLLEEESDSSVQQRCLPYKSYETTYERELSPNSSPAALLASQYSYFRLIHHYSSHPRLENVFHRVGSLYHSTFYRF